MFADLIIVQRVTEYLYGLRLRRSELRNEFPANGETLVVVVCQQIDEQLSLFLSREHHCLSLSCIRVFEAAK